MQNYQLDLTGYLCPLPLLILKRVVRDYVKPYKLIVILNKESEKDIALFCLEEQIEIIDRLSEQSIRLELVVTSA